MTLTGYIVCICSRCLKTIGADKQGEYDRVRPWLLARLNAYGSGGRSSRRAMPLPRGLSHWQRGCPELIPGKRRDEFW